MPYIVRKPLKLEDVENRMIRSHEGWENVDIGTELPYLLTCDEFDEWLDRMEAVDACLRMAERGFTYD